MKKLIVYQIKKAMNKYYKTKHCRYLNASLTLFFFKRWENNRLRTIIELITTCLLSVHIDLWFDTEGQKMWMKKAFVSDWHIVPLFDTSKVSNESLSFNLNCPASTDAPKEADKLCHFYAIITWTILPGTIMRYACAKVTQWQQASGHTHSSGWLTTSVSGDNSRLFPFLIWWWWEER